MKREEGTVLKHPAVRLLLSMMITGTIGVFRRFLPMSSAGLACLRGLIGGTGLFLYVKLAGIRIEKPASDKQRIGMILGGIALGINWILLFEAFNFTTVAKATLCYYLEPTIVILLSPVLFQERLTRRRLFCAGVSLLGMILVSGVLEGGAAAQDLKGIFYALGAACFYALVVIINKKTGPCDPWEKSIVQLLSAAAVLVPYLLLRNEIPVIHNAQELILVLIIGLVHTGLAYALYFSSLPALPAQTISLLSYIDPVTALFVSALFLGESLQPLAMLGAVMILGAAILGERENDSE